MAALWSPAAQRPASTSSCKEVAHGEADSRGEWVLLAQGPPLGSDQHELRVIHRVEGRAPVISEQIVIVVVPARQESFSDDAKKQTLVVIAPRERAATLVQPLTSAGVPKARDLSVSTLDFDERGQATITDQAASGSTVRTNIDDKMVGESVADADGSLRRPSPVTSAEHQLRLDRLGQDGKPTSRLEMPFDRTAVAPVAGDKRRLSVVYGDNLWNVAHAGYGEGWRYTVIFEANKSRIRDPNLIYPGQLFSLPEVIDRHAGEFFLSLDHASVRRRHVEAAIAKGSRESVGRLRQGHDWR